MTMDYPILSICIPTYNRSEYLLRTIEAIAQQLQSSVEVVICDNASTDDTARIVNEYIQAHPTLHIRFLQNAENIGFDRNVLRVVQEAAGEYCWLLSDDDIILESSLQRILGEIHTHEDTAFFLVNYQRFDKLKNSITADRMIGIPKDIYSRDANDFYFHPAPKSYFYILGTNMITMSVDVFRKDWWDEVVPSVEKFIGLNYIHVFVLSSVLWNHPLMMYIARPLVQYLSNNSRDWGNDIWKDYKNVYLEHLEALGYDPQKIEQVRRSSMNRIPLKDCVMTLVWRLLTLLRR